MTKTIRSIIVGMGGISRSMLRVLAEKDWHEAVAVVDVNPDALQQAGADLSLPESALYTDLDRAFAEAAADAVLINTPSEWHYPQTEAALRAGLSPLVAKPLSNNFAHSQALVNLAAERGVKLAVGQQMRYFRHYLTAAEFVRGGALGHVEQIYFFNAKPRHQARNLAGFEQPVLWEMTCHHLDCLFAVLPELEPESVICDGYLPSWSVYDSACMINGLFRFSGGQHMIYHAGYSTQSDCYELRLEGSKGALRCRGLHMSKNEMTYEFAERGGPFEVVDLDGDRPPTVPWSLFFDRWQEWLASGPDADEPHFSGRNNLKVLATIDAAIRSLDAGAFLPIAADERYSGVFGSER